MIGTIISGVVSLATQWFQNKREKAQAKHERQIKQIANDASWEQTQAEGAKHSLKDEWFAAVLSIPLIGAFIPSLVPYIQEGFAVLGGMPDYYKAYLGGAVAASFGLKGLANVWKK
ncbi:MAG: hypothetical protein HRU11_12320 [Parvularculaceae bacterium]|nr:hypothetical protein [Parvularculaceae bacterium]